MRLEKFSSSNAIGSDAFFEREQESRRSASYEDEGRLEAEVDVLLAVQSHDE